MKLPDIGYEGLGDSTLVCQKAIPLLTLSKTEMTLPELKILDVYLGRINSHDPSKRLVRFSKGELEQILGIERINLPQLKTRIWNLMSRVQLPCPDDPNRLQVIVLFEFANCERDDDGLWQIELKCSESAMEYFFSPEKIGYLRYNLKNVINLKSRYSYTLYLYLEQNRFMHLCWEVEVDEIREILRCTGDSYKRFKTFHDQVLKRCHEEIEEKTSCRFNYNLIRVGRKVKYIEFILDYIDEKIYDTLLVLPNNNKESDIALFEWTDNVNPKDDFESDIRMYGDSVTPPRSDIPEFTPMQVRELMSLLSSIPDEYLPNENITVDNDRKFREITLLEQLYLKMGVHKNNRFGYLCAMIRNYSN